MFLKIEINLDKPIYIDKEHIESNAILKKKKYNSDEDNSPICKNFTVQMKFLIEIHKTF